MNTGIIELTKNIRDTWGAYRSLADHPDQWAVFERSPSTSSPSQGAVGKRASKGLKDSSL